MTPLTRACHRIQVHPEVFAKFKGLPIQATLIIGTLHNLEEVAMTWILPTWTFDVKTLAAAWQIRRTVLTKLT